MDDIDPAPPCPHCRRGLHEVCIGWWHGCCGCFDGDCRDRLMTYRATERAAKGEKHDQPE